MIFSRRRIHCCSTGYDKDQTQKYILWLSKKVIPLFFVTFIQHSPRAHRRCWSATQANVLAHTTWGFIYCRNVTNFFLKVGGIQKIFVRRISPNRADIRDFLRYFEYALGMDRTIEFKPIFLGVLVAMGFLVSVALFALALSVTWTPSSAMPWWAYLVLTIVVIAVMLLGFSCAAITACLFAKALTPALLRLYPLATWALMTCIFAGPIILTTGLTGLGMKPYIFTDINVLKTNAVTTLNFSSPTDKLEDRPKAYHQVLLVAWASFISIGLGAYISILAARYAERKRWFEAMKSPSRNSD